MNKKVENSNQNASQYSGQSNGQNRNQNNNSVQNSSPAQSQYQHNQGQKREPLHDNQGEHRQKPHFEQNQYRENNRQRYLNKENWNKPLQNASAPFQSKTIKIKSEETIDDIKTDILRIEKEIELEIKEIRSLKLGL